MGYATAVVTERVKVGAYCRYASTIKSFGIAFIVLGCAVSRAAPQQEYSKRIRSWRVRRQPLPRWASVSTFSNAKLVRIWQVDL